MLAAAHGVASITAAGVKIWAGFAFQFVKKLNKAIDAANSMLGYYCYYGRGKNCDRSQDRP